MLGTFLFVWTYSPWMLINSISFFLCCQDCCPEGLDVACTDSQEHLPVGLSFIFRATMRQFQPNLVHGILTFRTFDIWRFLSSFQVCASAKASPFATSLNRRMAGRKKKLFWFGRHLLYLYLCRPPVQINLQTLKTKWIQSILEEISESLSGASFLSDSGVHS